MNVFFLLKKIRTRQKKDFSWLTSLEDFDILVEIGIHQANAAPISVKQLVLLHIAPARTIMRRLNRLKAQGVIIQTPRASDRRTSEFSISPNVLRKMRNFTRVMSRLSKSKI